MLRREAPTPSVVWRGGRLRRVAGLGAADDVEGVAVDLDGAVLAHDERDGLVDADRAFVAIEDAAEHERPAGCGRGADDLTNGGLPHAERGVQEGDGVGPHPGCVEVEDLPGCVLHDRDGTLDVEVEHREITTDVQGGLGADLDLLVVVDPRRGRLGSSRRYYF